MIPCPYCEQVFGRTLELAEHLLAHHDNGSNLHSSEGLMVAAPRTWCRCWCRVTLWARALPNGHLSLAHRLADHLDEKGGATAHYLAHKLGVRDA